MCECSACMEQHCPGGLTQKEELLLLLNCPEMGKGKRISRETPGEPSAAAVTWTARNQCSWWGLSPQNLSQLSTIPDTSSPLKLTWHPNNRAHARTRPWPRCRCTPTRLARSPTAAIVSPRLLGVPVPTEAVGRAAPRPRELSDPRSRARPPPHPCSSHGQIPALAKPSLAAGLIRLIKCN